MRDHTRHHLSAVPLAMRLFCHRNHSSPRLGTCARHTAYWRGSTLSCFLRLPWCASASSKQPRLVRLRSFPTERFLCLCHTHKPRCLRLAVSALPHHGRPRSHTRKPRAPSPLRGASRTANHSGPRPLPGSQSSSPCLSRAGPSSVEQSMLVTAYVEQGLLRSSRPWLSRADPSED
jgi:hypothetical protein